MYNDFTAVYHIPKQFMLSGENENWEWPYRETNESYKMRFRIGGITIMRKRNKQKSKCIESGEEYDSWVIRLHNNQTQCNSPYRMLDKKLPMCHTKQLMKQALFDKWDLEGQNIVIPCRTMQGIEVQHLESAMPTPKGEPVGEFWFSASFRQPTFNEIEQKRYFMLV